MKKTKLLLTAPILLAPIITTIPLMASCHKQADFAASGDITQYADITVLSKKLVVDEPYIIELSIKEDQIGKKFLPNSLTKVTSGGIELSPLLSGTPANVPHYYIYTTTENNTVATLTVGRAQGPVTLEASTAELKSISAYGVDIAKEGCAEFEVGETLANDTDRVLVEASLTNNDTFYLQDSYTVTLDGIEAGQTLKETDKCTGATGYVTYLNKNAPFKYNIIDKTIAYFFNNTEGACTKFTSIGKAVEAYNKAGAGEYIISINDGVYQFTNANKINIEQAADKYLTFQAWSDLTWDGHWTYHPVTFEYTPTNDGDSLITISANAGLNDNSSIDIKGIKFVRPEGATITKKYSYVSLDNKTAKHVHDITFKVCRFVGDATDPTKVDAVSTPTSTPYDPTLITIESCAGYYLNNLFNGSTWHDGSTVTYSDLYIHDCLLIVSNKLFSAKGSGMKALIQSVAAGLMYKANTTQTTNAIAIEAPGEYTFRYCDFEQLEEYAGATKSSFIDISCDDKAASHKINLYGVAFTKVSGATKPIYAVNLNTSSDDVVWDIFSWDLSSAVEAEVKKSDPSWKLIE